MDSETKVCQNCKQDFIIESDDFAFYEKMKVPAPTFCPSCRFQRRIMFRNERTLYKRKCDLCSKDMVTIFSPDSKLVVYCSACWWSDKWDDGEYSLEYDSSRSFFEQMIELQKKTPHMSLINEYATLINSDYVNHAGGLKNCYLIFNADFCENVLYSTIVVHVKDSMDCHMVGESELMYQDIDSTGYRLFFSESCSKCSESYFLKNCIGCDNCFGCINLRNKKYHIFNKPYTKEEYLEKIKEYKLNSYNELSKIRKIVDEFWLGYPNKYMHKDAQCVNVSGEYVFRAKNALNCYQARELEDARYCQFITMPPAKDIYDLSEWGNGAQRIVDCITVGEGADIVKFTCGAWHQGTMEIEYGMYNVSCQYSFGCMNQKKKRYRILNKQYSAEEYVALRARIIEDMDKNPYIDSVGRTWHYGEFLPYDLSPFAYNESQAIQYFPLSKEAVLKNGWKWCDQVTSNHNITLSADKVPDDIKDVEDSIVKEIMGCSLCGKAFKITSAELALLRRFKFPVSHLCSDCRHTERIARINPNKLWHRSCMKPGCTNEFETSYDPARPEIVYCEQCYQQEVA
ncbi:MAG: hypothetical protein WC711_02050 [Candidatus Staskawiczbacteria bacterium]